MDSNSDANAQTAARLYRDDRVHTPLPHPDAVDAAALERYRREGFIAVENVLSPEQVQAASEAVMFLVGGGNPAFQGVEFERAAEGRALTPEERESFVRKMMSFTEYDPRLKAMAENPVLLSIARRLIGTELKLLQEMALLKPARVGREKPWHQDTAYFLYEPLDMIIGTWTALDAATVENGCMHVIPGSHRDGPQPHYHVRDCQMADDTIQVQRDVAVPLQPGGVLFFSGLLHHGTPPNQSPQRRRALQFHYASVECRQITAQQHGELFKDQEGYAGCASHEVRRTLPVSRRVF